MFNDALYFKHVNVQLFRDVESRHTGEQTTTVG